MSDKTIFKISPQTKTYCLTFLLDQYTSVDIDGVLEDISFIEDHTMHQSRESKVDFIIEVNHDVYIEDIKLEIEEQLLYAHAKSFERLIKHYTNILDEHTDAMRCDLIRGFIQSLDVLQGNVE